MNEQEKKSMTLGIAAYFRLLGYVKRYGFIFLLGIVATMIAAAVEAGFVWGLQPLLDDGFVARDRWFIQWMPIIVITAFLVRAIANFTSNYCITWVARRVIMQIRQQLFEQLLHLPASYYDQRSSGQLLSVIIYNVEQVAEASTKALLSLLREGGLMIGLIFVMLINSWQLTLIFLVTTPILASITAYTSRRLKRLGHQVQDAVGNVTHVAEEGIEGYKVIRSFGSESYEMQKFTKETQYNFNREMKMLLTHAMMSPVVQIVVGFVIAMTIYLAMSESLQLTAGAFTSMVTAMIALLKPLKTLSSLNISLQKGIASAESIFSMLDEKREKDTGTQHIKKVKGDIAFQGVSFSYHGHTKVLDKIDFNTEAGKTIALVGRSGSGKSTLVSLLQHFYDHYEGKILLDGQDIRDIKLSDLRQQFAVVSQNVMLFNDTVAHNIAYGVLENVGQRAIAEAARAAHALEFIEALPQGFDTMVGEDGVRLSGGQRQRIAIARALLKNAPILVLDEATSALDTESERHIQAAIENLKHNKTTLVIAHRLSTVEKADQILVLDHGKIVERGKHSELLTEEGVYARLYRMQFEE